MASKEASKAYSSRLQLTGLRQPYVQIEPDEESRCHLMSVNIEELENFHHHRVQRETKTGDEEIAEDYNLVRLGLRFSLPGRRSLSEASFEDTSFLHVVDHALSHVALYEDLCWREASSFAGRHDLGRIRRAQKLEAAASQSISASRRRRRARANKRLGAGGLKCGGREL